MKRNLLITSVGSLVGQNILDALDGRRRHLHIVGGNSLVEAVGNFRCDACFLLPPTDLSQVFCTALRGLIDETKAELVIPARDADVVALARLGELHTEYAPRLLVGCSAMAEVMDDKLQSHRFAAERGLLFAPTAAGDDAEAASKLVADYGFPLIAKPKDGNGSRGIRILQTAAHLEAMLGRPGYAIQPFFDASPEPEAELPGLPLFQGRPDAKLYGVQTLIGRDGRLGPSLGFCAVMVMGRAERLVEETDPALLRLGRDFAAALAKAGWRGPVNVQAKKDARRGFLAIEMNGRFSGGTGARRHLGLDELGWILSDWLGEELPKLPAIAAAGGVVLKSLTDYPLCRHDMDNLGGAKRWTASS